MKTAGTKEYGGISLELFGKVFVFSSDRPEILRLCIEKLYGHLCRSATSGPENSFSLFITALPEVEIAPPPGDTLQIRIDEQEHPPRMWYSPSTGNATAVVFDHDDRTMARRMMVAVCSLVRLALKKDDIYFFHAAAVALSGSGVLIGGPNGSGKSSAMRSLIESGAEYLADDSAALDVSSSKPEIMRNPELLNAADLSYRTREKLAEKGFVEPQDPVFLAPPAESLSAPVKLLLFPGIVKAGTDLVSLTKKEAVIKLLELNKTPVFRDDYDVLFHLCGRIADSAPAYEVFVGHGSVFPSERIVDLCEPI